MLTLTCRVKEGASDLSSIYIQLRCFLTTFFMSIKIIDNCFVTVFDYLMFQLFTQLNVHVSYYEHV